MAAPARVASGNRRTIAGCGVNAFIRSTELPASVTIKNPLAL